MGIRPVEGVEVQRLMGTRNSSMQDACIIQRWFPTGYTDDPDETPCQWGNSGNQSSDLAPSIGGEGAEVAFARSTPIGMMDRLKLTKRANVPVEPPEIYEISDPPEAAAHVQILAVRRLREVNEADL